jgi:O-antigen/teichoic acid export membrane protein
LLGALSQTEFGVWVVVSQSASLLALSDLGAGNAIGRFVARARGRGDRDELSEVLSTVLAILFVSGAAVALLTYVLASHVPVWVGAGRDYRRLSMHVFMIVGFGIAAQLPLRIALGVLLGHQLYGPHAIGRIAESLLGLAGVVGLSLTGRLTLISLALVTAISAVVAQCILVVVAWHYTRPWGLSVSRVTGPMARRLFGMGASGLLATAATMVHTQGTAVMAGRLIGVASAGIYGVAFTVIANLYPLITSLAIPLSTLSSEWQARNDLAQVRRTNLRVMRLTFAMALCIAVGLMLFGEPALRWWLQTSDWTDDGFVQAGRALSVMGFALAIGLPHFGSRSTLLGVGQHWQVGGGVFAASIVSLACGVAAMKLGLGVVGAAIGWSVVWVLQGTVLFPRLISRYLDEPIGDTLRRGYLPGAILGCIVAVTGFGLRAWVAPARPLEHALVAFPLIITSLGGLLFLAPRGWRDRFWRT